MMDLLPRISAEVAEITEAFAPSESRNAGTWLRSGDVLAGWAFVQNSCHVRGERATIIK